MPPITEHLNKLIFEENVISIASGGHILHIFYVYEWTIERNFHYCVIMQVYSARMGL